MLIARCELVIITSLIGLLIECELVIARCELVIITSLIGLLIKCESVIARCELVMKFNPLLLSVNW